jgi:hypothetical protein
MHNGVQTNPQRQEIPFKLTMAEVILKIDPEQYQKYVTKVSGKDVINVILKKALYGTLQATLLFWQNLPTQLQEWGL